MAVENAGPTGGWQSFHGRAIDRHPVGEHRFSRWCF
jgi:hypothetical protein